MSMSDPSAPLTNEELDHISTVVAADWERVGTHLGLDQRELDTLRIQPCSLYQKAFLSLHRWTLDCVDPHCRVLLAGTLRKAGFGKLARKMRSS